MQQYNEGDIADGPDGQSLVFRGGQWVPMGAAAPQPFTIGAPDPTRAFAAPKAETDLAAARARAQEAAAQAPYAGTIAKANADKAIADARLASIQAAQGNQGRGVSPAVRKEAITGYASAQQLDGIIKDLEQKFAAGPGATTGISGLMDYLPTTPNQQFDAAGNAARGIVGQALGFTGGQLNTAREAEMAVGPYLPQSGDRDAVIRDKIERLKELRDTAMKRSVAQLGGVPDQNGQITAERETVDTTPAMAAGPAMGGMAVATGAQRTESDPAASAIIDRLVRNGGTVDQANQALQLLGLAPVNAAQFNEAQAYHRKNPGYKGSFADITRQVDNTARQRVAGSPGGAMLSSAVDAASAGLLGRVAGRDNLEAMQAANPTASMIGTLGGGVAGAAALEGGLAAAGARLAAPWAARLLSSPRTADALYGAVSGANADPSNPAGALLGAASGLGGGMLGRGLTRAAGRFTRGVAGQDVRALADRGIPLTVGQAVGDSGTVGAAVKGIEDRLTGAPVIGDLVKTRRLEGIRGMNTAAFNEGLAPIGEQIGGSAVGEPAVDMALDATGRGFNRALAGVNLRPDPQFASGIQAAAARGAATPTYGPDFQAIIQDEVSPIVGGSAAMNGQQFQDVKRTLGGYGTQYDQIARGTAQVPPTPMARRVSGAFNDMEGELDALVGRQAPDVLPAYNAANGAYRNVKVLQDAVNRARNGTRVGEPGLFAGSQLVDAAAANAKKYGNSAGTTRQPFYDLSRAAQRVLPSSVPDSGTAGRLALLALPGVLGGAGVTTGYATGDAGEGAQTGAALGALLAAGGTRTGQRALTSLLLDRPDVVRRAGVGLINRSRYGGIFGAAMGATAPMLLGE